MNQTYKIHYLKPSNKVWCVAHYYIQCPSYQNHNVTANVNCQYSPWSRRHKNVLLCNISWKISKEMSVLGIQGYLTLRTICGSWFNCEINVFHNWSPDNSEPIYLPTLWKQQMDNGISYKNIHNNIIVGPGKVDCPWVKVIWVFRYKCIMHGFIYVCAPKNTLLCCSPLHIALRPNYIFWNRNKTSDTHLHILYQ